MSRVHQVKCDGCRKIQEDTRDNAMPEWRDPDRWDGWWSLDVAGDGREHYDLCCLKCLKEWVGNRVEYWERYEKEAVDLKVDQGRAMQ